MQNINIEEFQDCTGINLTGFTPPSWRGEAAFSRQTASWTRQDARNFKFRHRGKVQESDRLTWLNFPSSVWPGFLLSRSILILNNKHQCNGTIHPVLYLLAALIQEQMRNITLNFRAIKTYSFSHCDKCVILVFTSTWMLQITAFRNKYQIKQYLPERSKMWWHVCIFLSNATEL